MNQDELDVLTKIFGSANVFVFDEVPKMTGVVAKIVEDRRFGFIKGEDNVQYFFHQSDLSGFWEDLVEDINRKKRIEVEFTSSKSAKGPRASNVSRLDAGAPLPTD